MPLDNFSLVDVRSNGGRLFRSAQPDVDGFVTLAHVGITKIYSLRETADDCDIGGVDCVLANVPMLRPSIGDISALVGLIHGDLETGLSVLVHCARGIDRTGTVIGAYRLLVNHWSLSAVMAEFKRYADLASEVMDGALLDILEAIAGHA